MRCECQCHVGGSMHEPVECPCSWRICDGCGDNIRPEVVTTITVFELGRMDVEAEFCPACEPESHALVQSIRERHERANAAFQAAYDRGGRP